ncbi:pyridine nucleotide-disulphide oxidoreductase class-ii [Trichococcus palustris]|uniref:Ferredoxin--NADP reductase n=1 Tax=Trichococcus palustris TaxID=140314 RepID=A0A143YZW6_9LACT|nr:NAD(P)/FAD-dependent oxidoreductase [Trichococcus palustris]CZR02939.1 pyridine nucleotide-disulphide oxidoreductase class-ii [Trichococcus palustris]SFL22374.1 thioredoxin reductase (NADPH) [Trichococcus palustris]
MNPDELYDLTIIGGGPVGMFTAFYAGLRQAKVKIIEALPQLGGQPGMLYAEKNIYDIAGYPIITGEELIKNLKTQMDRFDTTLVYGEEAFELNKNAEGIFEIQTTKNLHYSKAVIISAGNGAFRPRKLEIEHAEKYENNNLHYFVNNIESFRDKTVAICGGGDSAVDWALTLEPIAKKVYLIHRRPQFRAQEHSVQLLNESSIETITPFVPISINGSNDILTSVTLQEARKENTMELEIDDFLINYGFSSSIGGMKKWGFEVNGNAIVVNSKMETTIPGVYAIGDISTYEGKVKLIATGFGEAPVAVNNAMVYINPDTRVQPMHSTSLF